MYFNKNILAILFVFSAYKGISNDIGYRPDAGDKFLYTISFKLKQFESVFIYDVNDKVPTLRYKWGTVPPVWGIWTEPKVFSQTLINNLSDTGVILNSNLIYLNKEIFKQLVSGNNFKLTIKGETYTFKLKNTIDYNLPIQGAFMTGKVHVAATEDGRCFINVLDNSLFPLVTSMSGDISWQLQTIVPLPMYPMTHNLIGLKIDDPGSKMFKTYITETCATVDVAFTENFSQIHFTEYFCPIAGVRFSLKNDTMISLKLQSASSGEDGYKWQSYRGYIWGTFKLGDKKSSIEKKYGKPAKTSMDRNYYPERRFYLKYNSRDELTEVEYE